MNKIDKALFYDIIALFLTGIIFVYSSSYYIAGIYTHDPYYFSIRQVIWSSVSFVFLLFFMRFDYHNLKNFVKPLIFITILLLLAVFIPGLGRVSGGARRWIDLKLFEFNPSELAKVSVIIYLSFILTKKQAKLENFTFGLLPPLLLVASIFFIILIQSNFSTAALLLIVSFLIFFSGRGFDKAYRFNYNNEPAGVDYIHYSGFLQEDEDIVIFEPMVGYERKRLSYHSIVKIIRRRGIFRPRPGQQHSENGHTPNPPYRFHFFCNN